MTTLTTPTLTDLAVAAGLERLAADAEGPRWAAAYRKALYYWQSGIRPEPTLSGGWLIPSATRGGVVHQVSKDGRCSCEARGSGCWHAALALGLDIGYDHIEQGLVGDPDDPEAPRGIDDVEDNDELPTDGPTDYGRMAQRIAAARARFATIEQGW